jgi:hypothetical protein
MLPLFAVSKQKTEYTTLDLHDWARFWSVVDKQEGWSDQDTAVRWPDKFPIRTPTILRCAVLEPKCVPALCKCLCSIQRQQNANRILL